MKLPKSDRNEDLEEMSNRAFVALFDVTKFLLRPEIKDKGIDYRIEIKISGAYTGFQFLVQLKSSESISKNEDGSWSLSIETANIQYLLNSGSPSYYVLYLAKEKQLFYKSVNELHGELLTRVNDIDSQDSYTIRFIKKLDHAAVDNIYRHTCEDGRFMRAFRKWLAVSNNLVDDRVVIDPYRNVASDSDIRRMIEVGGLHLINEARWSDVISLHKKASQQVGTTAKYNMVVGIAYYYVGELANAMVFLRSAVKLISELSEELKEHLLFYQSTVKYSLGMISKGVYKDSLHSFNKSSHIIGFLKVERIKENYANSLPMSIDEAYEIFYDEMNAVINSSTESENIKLMTRCELVYYEGIKINTEYTRAIAISKAIGGLDKAAIEVLFRNALSRKSEWENNTRDLQKELFQTQNYFSYFHVSLNFIKVNYEFEVYINLFNFNDSKPPTLHVSRLEIWDKYMKALNDAIHYYKKISHIENVCAVLFVKYELLHFKEDYALADQTLTELSSLISSYELNHLRANLNTLKNEGPCHQRFYASVKEVDEQDRQLRDRLGKEFDSLEQLDKAREITFDNPEVITLYPIGHFTFPKEKRKKVFEILCLDDAVQNVFDLVLDAEGIASVNVFHDPITTEGIGDGLMYSDANETWDRIFRIRQAFFENTFPRIVLKGEKYPYPK